MSRLLERLTTQRGTLQILSVSGLDTPDPYYLDHPRLLSELKDVYHKDTRTVRNNGITTWPYVSFRMPNPKTGSVKFNPGLDGDPLQVL